MRALLSLQGGLVYGKWQVASGDLNVFFRFHSETSQGVLRSGDSSESLVFSVPPSLRGEFFMLPTFLMQTRRA